MSDASFEEKRDAALRVLKARGIVNSNQTKLVNLYWKCGLKTPHPFFMGFIGRSISSGAFFGFFLTACMVPIYIIDDPSKFLNIIKLVPLMILGAGAPYGLIMGGLRTHALRKYKLPKWSDLNSSSI